MTKGRRILFAGGGTAGHINPALTVAKLLKDGGAEVHFAGTPGGLEADLVPRAGFQLHHVRVKPLPRRVNLALFKAIAEATVGLSQAFRIVRRLRPDVVVGTGGYVAGPVLLAAATLRVPTVIHEQNAFPGGTNRALARVVNRVALGYKEAAARFGQRDKLVFVGNPIRPEIIRADRRKGIAALGLRSDCLTVIIFGGSRGARSINRAVFDARDRLHSMSRLQIIHQTGATEFPEISKAYAALGIKPKEDRIVDRNIRVVPYLYNMPEALAAADLVVSRSGALTVAELAARGLPSILVPYPYATADHQTFNARPLVDSGAAVLIPDNQLTGDTLADNISKLVVQPAHLKDMAAKAKKFGRPDAAQELVDLILSVADKG